jgi:hypothetical protein
MTDRYLKIILTIIAVELLWLGVKDVGTPVSAQAGREVTPVVIQGIELGPGSRAMPVYAAAAEDAGLERPLPVSVGDAVDVNVGRPLEVYAERPLPVRAVRDPPAERPGE